MQRHTDTEGPRLLLEERVDLLLGGLLGAVRSSGGLGLSLGGLGLIIELARTFLPLYKRACALPLYHRTGEAAFDI